VVGILTANSVVIDVCTRIGFSFFRRGRPPIRALSLSGETVALTFFFIFMRRPPISRDSPRTSPSSSRFRTELLRLSVVLRWLIPYVRPAEM